MTVTIAEELLLLRTRHGGSARDFDCDRAVELFVASFPDAAKAADAQPLDQFEAS